MTQAPGVELDQVIDAEIVEQLDEKAAKRLDQGIRLIVGTVRDSIEKLQDKVHDAKAGHIHIALGFSSWTAYLADVFGDQPLVLEKDERRELVEFLSGEGMSTRAIAPVVGASKDTVHRDLATVSNETVELAPEKLTTGLDGKQRPAKKPNPKPPAIRQDPPPHIEILLRMGLQVAAFGAELAEIREFDGSITTENAGEVRGYFDAGTREIRRVVEQLAFGVES